MHRYLPALLLAALLIAFRAAGSVFPELLPNFQPLAALFFCGALMAPGWRGFVVPLGIWMITFPLGTGHTSSPAVFLTTLAALSLSFLMGKSLMNRSAAALISGSVAAALLFHLVTNGSAWIGDPRYAKTLTGLWQSLWTGAPGDVLPTWVFLRNMATANVIFTGMFLLSRAALPRISTLSAPDAVQHR